MSIRFGFFLAYLAFIAFTIRFVSVPKEARQVSTTLSIFEQVTIQGFGLKERLRSFRRRPQACSDSSEAGFSPEYSLGFPESVSSPWLCSDGAERPDDRPVCGDSLDLPGYDEVRGQGTVASTHPNRNGSQ